MNTDRPARPLTHLWSELLLLCVSLSVISITSRTLENQDDYFLLLFLAFALHFFLILMRRINLSRKISYSLTFIFYILFQIYLSFPETLSNGVATLSSFDAFFVKISDGITLLLDTGFPLTGGDELQALFSVLIFVVVFLSDVSAFVYKKASEAIIPHLTLLFVFLYIAPKEQNILSVVFVAVTIFGFVLVHKLAFKNNVYKTVKIQVAKFTKAYMVTGLSIATFAILLGVIVGPVLPGTRSDALIDTLNVPIPVGAGRVVLNPLVNVRSQLTGDFPEVDVFQVRTDVPTYWKLTNLDNFDGNNWTTEADNYRRASSSSNKLPSQREELSVPVEYSFQIDRLGGPWIPHAYRTNPTSLETTNPNFGIIYSPTTFNLLTAQDDLQSGDTYELTSNILSASGQTLNEISSLNLPIPEEIQSLTALPADFPDFLRTLAESITSLAENDYQKALYLQEWFLTNFKYSESVPPGHSNNAMISFIQVKEGFCEQFSATFAAMARSLGIPTRVAVGFTAGQYTSAERTLINVTTRDAHAWPEIYIPTLGWIDFEPTPTRGTREESDSNNIPGTVSRLAPELLSGEETPSSSTGDTGQGTEGGQTGAGTTETTAPTPETPGNEETPTETTVSTEEENQAAEVEANESSSTTPLYLIVLIFLAGLFALYILTMNYARKTILPRSIQKMTPQEYVPLAWRHMTLNFSLLGITKTASETNTDFSRRAAQRLDIQQQELDILVSSTNEARYAPKPLDQNKADRAIQTMESLNEKLNEKIGLRKKLKVWLNPKPVFELRKEKKRLMRRSSY